MKENFSTSFSLFFLINPNSIDEKKKRKKANIKIHSININYKCTHIYIIHDRILNYIKDNIVEARLQERTLNNSAPATFPLDRPLPPHTRIQNSARERFHRKKKRKKKKINKPKNIPLSRALSPPSQYYTREETRSTPSSSPPFQFPSNFSHNFPLPLFRKNNKKKNHSGFPFNHLASCLHIYETTLSRAPEIKGLQEGISCTISTYIFSKNIAPSSHAISTMRAYSPSPLSRPTFALDRLLPPQPPSPLDTRHGRRRSYVRTCRGMRSSSAAHRCHRRRFN